MESVAVTIVLLVATLSRWYLLDARPGWEIDEVVYFRVTDNIAHYGVPVFKPEPGRAVLPYLSHPPFYFNILSTWYNVIGTRDIYAGRLLAMAGSLLAFALLYAFMREAAGRWSAFLCLLLVSTDGWIVFTNRIGWMENTQLIFVVLAMWLYFRAQRDGYLMQFALAGAYISIVILYKHIGAYILVGVLIHWLLQRRHWKGHLLLLGVVCVFIGGYVALMYYEWGHTFLAQYLNQFDRTIGAKQSRGLNYGLDKALTAVIAHYWIFFTTIACFVCGSVLSIVKLVGLLRGHQLSQRVSLSFALGALLSGMVLGLKSPHYFILWLVPLYCVLAIEIATIKINMRFLIALVVVLQINAITWNWRFMQQHDNLLMQTQAFATTSIPRDAPVVSEEAVCAIIPQPCGRFENYQTPAQLRQYGMTYIFPYYSTTQLPPESLWPFIASTTKLGEAAGFKDRIEFRQSP